MNRNPNHPKPGSSILAEPIRCQMAIKSIKKLLKNEPRNHCLFTMGINTNFKAKELLQLKVKMVKNKKPGDVIEVLDTRSGKTKSVILNKSCIKVLQKLMDTKHLADDDYLFSGPKGALKLPSLNRLVKQWCHSVNLIGNYGTHSLRKTFGYQQGVQYGVALPTLMKTFNHSTKKETLRYLGMKNEQIKSIFENEI